MKPGKNGFTFIELAVAIGIASLVCSAASVAAVQVLRGTGRNSEHLATTRQLQNAGYWITRDAQRAQTVETDKPLPDFLVLHWTEWDDPENPTYHRARYFFEGLTNGVGKLKRGYQSTAGGSEQVALVAGNMYYAPADVDHTSKASYESPLLSIRLTAPFGETLRTMEFETKHRPNL